MSDYPNPNLHRSDGVSGRAILVALGVVVFTIVLLAAIGGSNAPPANEATAPVAPDAPAAAPVPATD